VTNEAATATGPLTGVKVVDLSRLAPGPFASMLLGDLGADVLLVEAPIGAIQGIGGGGDDEAVQRRRAYNALARNKRSIVVNLKTDEGRELVHELAKDADVFLEGFRPGVTDRLGVGYAAISATNPGIVYCSLSGYGQTGPYSQLVGHDINYISVGGSLGMIGRGGDQLSIPQNTIADFAGGGLMSAFAIVSALVGRQQTGRGQYLDMAMSDGVTYLLASQASAVLAGGAAPVPGQPGLAGGSPHYDAYQCADGKFISLGSLEPQFWAALCEVSGRPDMADKEFDSTSHGEFKTHLKEMFKTKSRDEWFAELRDIELCVAPVLELNEVFENEHALARDLLVEVEDAHVGTVRQVGIGPKFSDTPGNVRSTAPASGAHTDEVLSDLGRDDAEIARLREAGVVG
jgi:crotonobetainyl-CoA:carnitine CoA-transferase CaiB-like acyl-CoA transferase